ncbi:MAG: glycosyltransferase family 4 protein [Pyrinomonadaceae bacterium]
MTKTFSKSVHITNYYHKNSGGISTSYNNLLAAAERHKKFIRLIVPGESEAIEEINDFARIYYVPAKYSPIFDKRYRLIMPWQYMPSGSPLRAILMAEMPDIIEVTDKYTLSMLGAMIRKNKFRQLNRPMLVHFSCERMDDNIASFMTKKPYGRWLARRVIGNYILPTFDFHIANSPYTAEEFFQSVKKPIIRVVPNGFSIGAGDFLMLRSFRLKSASRLVRAELTANIFHQTETLLK